MIQGSIVLKERNGLLNETQGLNLKGPWILQVLPQMLIPSLSPSVLPSLPPSISSPSLQIRKRQMVSDRLTERQEKLAHLPLAFIAVSRVRPSVGQGNKVQMLQRQGSCPPTISGHHIWKLQSYLFKCSFSHRDLSLATQKEIPQCAYIFTEWNVYKPWEYYTYEANSVEIFSEA